MTLRSSDLPIRLTRYFFTVNLLERKKTLLVNHIEELRHAITKTRKQKPFHIDGWVILPDHMHCIWTLPKGDDDYSGRWRAIKTTFSKSISKTEYQSKTRIDRNERGIWQRRFWEASATILSGCSDLNSLLP